MAQFFLRGKWKKRTITALSVALSLTCGLGIFTACGGTTDGENKEEEDTAATATDTQLLKNGNFEFYSEKDTELEKKRSFISSPTSWSFTSGSPTSDTNSGIINTAEWDTLTKSTRKLVPADDKTPAADAIDSAISNWDSASTYDRLEFLDKYKDEISKLDSKTDEAKFFADYKYTIDFDDVKDLRKELGDTLSTRDGADEKETNVLMIHNSRTSDGVIGTAQYYTSSTTITLEAGTAAEVSLWVRTANLKHYYSSSSVDVTSNAGAYLGVTHTVGGTSLDQMQIKNINTNGNWEQYSVYLRANTFASTTFRLVLGLGQGDTSNRYEQVNGYAFFDDVTCKVITNEAYEETVTGKMPSCTLNSLPADKIFNLSEKQYKNEDTFVIDLHEGFENLKLNGDEEYFDADLTKELSGTKEYKSLVDDNRKDGTTETTRQSIAGLYSYNALKDLAEKNGYLKNIFANDFESGKFPYENGLLDEANTVMLLSTNGAAYTATVKSDKFTVAKGERMLVSFFVKTSNIRNGKTGASATLVDGTNETKISAFDSTTVATVDIDETTTDIRYGWVQCFFFVENDTDDAQTFYLKLSYGPTSIANSKLSDYGDGYAAFANFETMKLTKVQYGYASTGERAKTVSLTGKVSSASSFDDASATSDIENSLATPVSFTGIQSGSVRVGGTNENPTQAELIAQGLYTGLLNADYAANYQPKQNEDAAWKTALDKIAEDSGKTDWWQGIFGDASLNGRVASQPLVMLNTAGKTLPAYGFFAKTATISASSYQKISLRVKLSKGATATIYLIDTSDVKAGFNNPLAPQMPNVTYWYDDEGNICSKDPSAKDFSSKTDVAYYLEENGLYTKKGETNGTYYANLANYNEDEDGNKVTTKGVIAYYNHEGTFYAYYDKDTNEYSQPVTALPTDGTIVRYTATTSEKYQSVMTVTGNENNAGSWVEVSFYIHTGALEKNYRLEVWAGTRDCTVDKNGTITKGIGIPKDGYLFFDGYSSASYSNYDSILAEMVDATKTVLNGDKTAGQVGYLGTDDNLPEDYALYSTFTFYDSPDYLRYDVNNDEDKLGNPYGSYKQSTYEEQLIWFSYSDNGTLTGSPVQAQFLDYGAYDVTVQEDDLGADDSTGDSSSSSDDNSTNIWLILSSALLAFALLFAIVAVIVRRILKRTRKNTSKRPPKQKKEKAPKLKIVKDEPEEETEDEPAPVEDENNPYND